MFEIVLSDIINKIPDSFLDGKKTTGNIYKIVKVFVEEINKDMETLNDVFELNDLDNQTGTTLELTAADYGLERGARTDNQLRDVIRAFQAATVIGNDINSILSLFRTITGQPAANVRIIEKFIPTLDNPRPRAFDLILDSLETCEGQAFLPLLLSVKSGAIDVTIDELRTDNFITQGNGDYLLQGNGGRLIIEPGNLCPH